MANRGKQGYPLLWARGRMVTSPDLTHGKETAVFTHVCSACDKRQLIFPSQVTAVAKGARGPVATFTCWCGATQSALLSLVAEPRRPREVELVA